MTKQEYYDALATASKDGTFPGYNVKVASCRYQQIDENDITHKCAVGILISDEQYHPEIEHCTINKIITTLEIDISLSAHQLEFIQEKHDEGIVHNNEIGITEYNYTWSPRTFMDKINRSAVFSDVGQEPIEDFKEILELSE